MLLFEQMNRLIIRGPEALVHAIPDCPDAGAQLAVCAERLAVRRGQLREDETFPELRITFEQPLDREELLLDALGVIEAIHTDTEAHVGRQAQLAADALVADRHRWRTLGPQARPPY